jgi:hypothetical protein
MTLLRDLVICNSSGVPDGTANGQYLRWNAASGVWEAQTVPTLPTGTQNKQYLRWNATASAWELINVIPVGDVDTAGATITVGRIHTQADAVLQSPGVPAVINLPNYANGLFVLTLLRTTHTNTGVYAWSTNAPTDTPYMDAVRAIAGSISVGITNSPMSISWTNSYSLPTWFRYALLVF